MHPFTSRPTASVAALGEVRLIAAIRRWLGTASPRAPFGIGDDCAVLPPSSRPPLLTVDPVIYGVHFDDTVPPRAVGAKLLKRNLSDIAAMGGRPRAAVVALALDPRVKLTWLEEFYRGLASASRRYRVPIVGGDVARHTGGIVASLTLLGEAAGQRVLTRTGARAGDEIYVTGRLGGAQAGHHHRFQPRLAEGAWLARRPEVVAMMDLSDGLAKDIWSLTPRGLVPSVSPRAIPVSPAAKAAARRSGRPAWHHALTDGEDYELLVVVRPAPAPGVLAADFLRKFAVPFRAIGSFARHVQPEHVEWASLKGYEHFNPA